MILKKCYLLLYLLTAVLSFGATGKGHSCPIVHIVPERLPDLAIPRSGHNIFYTNGELVVTGGHTTNFVPTPTAEYYADGSWHQLPMAYSHDNGFAVVMRSGEVIIGGGHEEPLGVGQTFMVERYTPATHSFEGFGCLDRRRTLSSATELSDGRVIIAGNHYANDAIGCYDGNSQIQHVGNVVQGHSNPYVLQTSADNAIILGSRDTRANPLDTVWADRVEGEPFRVPLLEEWKLVYSDQPFCSDACAIDNDSYLLTVYDKDGQLGIVLMHDTCFSMLPTVCPIPMQSQWGPVFYKGPIIVDRKRQQGYVMGVDSLYSRQYILAVDYSQKPAALTLYHTEMEHATVTIPIVTPHGDLILAGGIPGTNYRPLATVWCYHFGTAAQTTAEGSVWPWVITAIMAFAVLVNIIIYIRRRRNRPDTSTKDGTSMADDIPVESNDMPNDAPTELMERICRLMDEERLYLRNGLKVQDVAVRLNTNSNYVSKCISSISNQSFSQFVNTFRVRHAQELLRQRPNMKTAIIATESGFSNEASFFRNFKAVTNMTPREWLATID